MPSNHLILCHPLLLLPSVFASIRVFSKKLILHIRWPKYWRFSISPSNEYSGLIASTDCHSMEKAARVKAMKIYRRETVAQRTLVKIQMESSLAVRPAFSTEASL